MASFMDKYSIECIGYTFTGYNRTREIARVLL